MRKWVWVHQAHQQISDFREPTLRSSGFGTSIESGGSAGFNNQSYLQLRAIEYPRRLHKCTHLPRRRSLQTTNRRCPQILSEQDVAIGDVNEAGWQNVGELTPQGETMYPLHLKNEFLAGHIWKYLDPFGHRYLRNSWGLYEWKDQGIGEVYCKGTTMLIMCLHRIHPDTIIDTFKLISKIKKILLKDHIYDITDTVNEIYKQHDMLNEIDNTAYPPNQFDLDIFKAISEGAPKSFQKWVKTEKTKWIMGIVQFNEYIL